MEDLMNVLQRAADSILTCGYRNWGNVVKAEIVEETVLLTTGDGKEETATLFAHLVARPKDRELKPADVHDCVLSAMTEAYQKLSQ